jgi:hypothetical protein
VILFQLVTLKGRTRKAQPKFPCCVVISRRGRDHRARRVTRRANQGAVFQGACPAPFAKIFLFSPDANHFLIRPILSRKRGVGHRHERWGGMRWTRRRF